MAILEIIFEGILGGFVRGILIAIPIRIYRWCKVKGRFGTRITSSKELSEKNQHGQKK